MAKRSSLLRSLLVAWRCRLSCASSRPMPAPSSRTRTSLRPPSCRSTSMRRAPASSAFSTSSLTAAAGRSITSPAAIWLERVSGNTWMRTGARVSGIAGAVLKRTEMSRADRSFDDAAEVEPFRAAAFGADDRLQVGVGAVEVVVDHPVLVPLGAGEQDLDARGVEPPADGGVVVGGARPQPPLQLRHRRRQDERAQRLGILPLDGAAALHVDVEHRQHAAPLRLLDDHPRRPVAVAVHRRPLDELAGLDHRVETGVVDEVIIDALLLRGARRARGVADREDGSGVRRYQPTRQGGLPGARRRAEDEEGGAHSTLAICSRIRSSSDFSSTTCAAIPAYCDFDPTVLTSRFTSCTRNSSRRPAGASEAINAPSCARWLASR